MTWNESKMHDSLRIEKNLFQNFVIGITINGWHIYLRMSKPFKKL